jgi:squalene-hopene/tetraprenyl-beta-curcumene cyclase
MIVYRGVLHDAHLHAVVRAALRAHGFVMPDAEYQAAAREQWQLGCWLRDRALPERLAGSVTIRDYQQIAAADPSLWHQLPLMAALGFRQTRVLLGLMPGSFRAADTAALLGAVFNTGIALFDYLVDESPTGTGLFDVLNEDVVRGIFEPDIAARVELDRAGEHASDPRLRLLLGLVAAFGTLGKELVQRSGTDAGWPELRRLVMSLFEAEHAVSVNRCAPDKARDLLPALETKSALPSLTLLQVARMAGSAIGPSAPAERAAAALGHILWRIDDLVDLLTDCRRGTPTALLLNMVDRLADRGSAWASDADLYDIIDSTAEELVGILNGGAFGSPAFAEAHEDPALARVGRFARETVAGWTRWHEDADMISGPVATRSMRGNRGAADAALAMLLVQQRDNYREAIHHLSFPRHHVEAPHEVHPALLFQRSVALESLLDARAAGLPVPESVVNAEALTILRLKHRDVRGGWSYLPDLPEVPPDADDLGQVLQALTRLGGAALAFTCEEPIRLALDASGAHGGFPTWIFEPGSRSSADRRTRAYLQVIGGAGVHPDVVANLLMGLLLYDPVRYRHALLRAVPYLESMQEEHGSWRSHWYAGPYYGTYRVGTVLRALAPESGALSRARSFLLDDQRPDGAWGMTASEPLSTALAVLALTAVGRPSDAAAVERGLEYLASAQDFDGGWAACPWISFQTLDGVETYASRTISTAFSLKALAVRIDGAVSASFSRRRSRTQRSTSVSVP